MRNLMNNPIVQLLSFILLIVGALTLLSKSEIGRIILLIVVVLAVACALLALLIKTRPVMAAQLYHSHKVAGKCLDPLYQLLGTQPPADPRQGAKAAVPGGAAGAAGAPGGVAAAETKSPLRFDDPEFDFETEADALKELVRGHDQVIDSVFAHLERIYVHKSNKETESRTPPPHGLFLLVGPEGVGKVYLARRLAAAVFSGGGVFKRDMAECAGATAASALLFGGTDGSTCMIGAVRKQPYHAVILENIDTVPAEVLGRFHKVLSAGAAIDAASGGKVSFENCLFLFTATACVPGLCNLRTKFERPAPWVAAARQELAHGSSIPAPFLALLNDICVCRPPDGRVRAEVLVLLMQRECRSQGLELDWVDPDFLAEQVLQMDEAHGFSLLTPNHVLEIMGDAIDIARRRKAPVQVGGAPPRPAGAKPGAARPAGAAGAGSSARRETVRP